MSTQTLDLPSLGLRAIRCGCGRTPVLQSGRCWSCEPKPFTAEPRSHQAKNPEQPKPPTLSKRIADALAHQEGLTAIEIATAITADVESVRAKIQDLRRTGRAWNVEGDRDPRKAGNPPQVWFSGRRPEMLADRALRYLTCFQGRTTAVIATALEVSAKNLGATLHKLRGDMLRSEPDPLGQRWYVSKGFAKGFENLSGEER